MKRILLLFLILVTMQVAGQNQYTKYYKHLVFRETPYAQVRGRIEISRERTKNENHYKFTFNDKNKPILIEYLYGDKQISRKRAGIMDGFRNIYSKTVMSYQENLEIRTFYDTKGMQCKNGMNVFKEVYEYNNEGKRIGVKFYDRDNKLTNNTWNIAEYIWKPVGKYNMIEKRKNVKGEYVNMRPYYHFMTTLYKYTKDGMLISMNHIDESHNLINDFDNEYGISMDKAEYDNNLNLIGFKFYNTKKEHTIGSFLKSAGGKIEYDTNGNCINYATINLDGRLMISRGKAYDVYKFDTFGNNIEVAHYGLNQQPVEFRGYSKINFIYDTKNPSKKRKVLTLKK